MRSQFLVVSLLVIAAIFGAAVVWTPMLWVFVIVGPVFLLGIWDMLQKSKSIVRNFPLFGRGRYIMESLRPKIYQYFIESDVDGTPINRVYRSVIYQRAKRTSDTIPFGTSFDVYRAGYEWMNHSLAAKNAQEMTEDLRVDVGELCATNPTMPAF
jgi:hypothetical protein